MSPMAVKVRTIIVGWGESFEANSCLYGGLTQKLTEACPAQALDTRDL